MYTIKLLAPSGYASDQKMAQRAFEHLKNYDCQILNPEITQRHFQRFAGTDEERLSDWQNLINDPILPNIALILRGGYGAIRLLPQLDYKNLKKVFAKQPIILVGHSDFTAIQCALLSQAGIKTFSGPMLLSHFSEKSLSTFTLNHFWSLITQAESCLSFSVAQQDHIHVSGTLWGGNLSTLCALVGTDYLPNMKDGILFIEDVNEQPFRIERILYQLYLSGVLQKQKAIIFGQFTGIKEYSYDHHYNLNQVIIKIRQLINVPILTGLPIGHIQDIVTLPIGAKTTIISNAEGFSLYFSDYPYLHR